MAASRGVRSCNPSFIRAKNDRPAAESNEEAISFIPHQPHKSVKSLVVSHVFATSNLSRDAIKRLPSSFPQSRRSLSAGGF